MTKKKVASHDDSLPVGLSQPAIRALKSVAITRLSQVSKFTRGELLDLHGMGPNGIGKLEAALSEIGKSFASSGRS
jgi:hypothetical protein